MEKITLDEIEKLAKLARLGLTTKEKEALAPQMSEILNFAKQLDEVDVLNVEPTSQVTGLTNIFADDHVCKSPLTRAELLQNAPAQENGFIKVKSVL